jgi:hypothetical protein
MAEHDPDSRGWLRSHPLAHELVRSAETDVPAPGFEERLLDGLRSDRLGASSAQHSTADDSDFDAVDAVTDQRVQAVGTEARAAAQAKSPSPVRSRSAWAAYISAVAIAAIAVFAIWTIRGKSEQRPELAPRPIRAPAAQTEPNANAPCEQAVRADPALPLIDDFEDGNGRLLAHGGRFGTWSYIAVDGAGPALVRPLAPEAMGKPNNRHALHARGAERHDWRAVWATFGPACYDASAFAGIRFTGRGPAEIALQLDTVDAIERKYGGTCETDCGHGHRMRIELGDRWERYEVLFRELVQGAEVPPGARRAFDPRRLNALAFVVDPGSESFDFWIDDVEWIAR